MAEMQKRAEAEWAAQGNVILGPARPAVQLFDGEGNEIALTQRNYDARYFAQSESHILAELEKARIDLAAAKETIRLLWSEIEAMKAPPVETQPTFPARALRFAPMHKVGP